MREGKTRFVPERFDKTYNNWMENIRDWCISRQLWWGHRIPGITPRLRLHGGGPGDAGRLSGVRSTHFRQDEDTLDTWFSSALLAVFDTRLAGADGGHENISIRPACWSRAMTSSSSGWRA